jgi:hypothetical protein
MAAFTHGMNVDEVQALGRDLQNISLNVQQIVTRLDSLVAQTTWVGPDATEFKGLWWAAHKKNLMSISVELSGFGQSALNNASDQINTSSH